VGARAARGGLDVHLGAGAQGASALGDGQPQHERIELLEREELLAGRDGRADLVGSIDEHSGERRAQVVTLAVRAGLGELGARRPTAAPSATNAPLMTARRASRPETSKPALSDFAGSSVPLTSSRSVDCTGRASTSCTDGFAGACGRTSGLLARAWAGGDEK